MNDEVSLIGTATAGQLMKNGVADKLVVEPGSSTTVCDVIKDAHEAEAKFSCCPANLDLFEMTETDPNPECADIVGGVPTDIEVATKSDISLFI